MRKHFEAKVLIKNDLFDIAKRLREIDKGYLIFYDKRKGRFEVWHRESRSITPEVVVPYPELDARTVDMVQKTRVKGDCYVIKRYYYSRGGHASA